MMRLGRVGPPLVAGLVLAGLVAPGKVAWARETPLPPPQPSYDLLLDARVQIDGTAADDHLGSGVATGDFNGDGVSDVALASQRAGALVLFGPFDTPIVNLADADLAAGPVRGYWIRSRGDLPARSIRSAGDVNGDGRDDLLVRARADRVYVVHGASDTVEVNLASLGSTGFTIHWPDGDIAAVDGAGDVNRDGLADVVVGGLGSGASGEAYVVFGRTATDPITLRREFAAGYQIDVSGLRQDAGSPTLPVAAVSAAGDVNADGRDDVLVGIPTFVDSAGTMVGAAWAVFGKANATPVQLGRLGSAGYRIQGVRTNQAVGTQVAAGGDVNGDRVPDHLVLGADPDATSQLHVVFGSGASTRTVRLAENGFRGYRITAPPGELLRWGAAIMGGFDANGDGLADQAMSAPHADVGGRQHAGVVYVAHGQSAQTDIDLASYQSGFRIDGQASYADFGADVATLARDGTTEILGGAPDNPARGLTYAGSAFLVGPPSRFPASEPDLLDVRLGTEPLARLVPGAGRRARLSVTMTTATALTARADVSRLVSGRRSGTARDGCVPTGGAVSRAQRCTAVKRLWTASRAVPAAMTWSATLPRTLPPGRYLVSIWGTAAASGRVSGPFGDVVTVPGR